MCVAFGLAIIATRAAMREMYAAVAQMSPVQTGPAALLTLALSGMLVAGAAGHLLRSWFMVPGVLSLIKGAGLFVPGGVPLLAAWYSQPAEPTWRGIGVSSLMLGSAMRWRHAGPPRGHDGRGVGALRR